MVESIWNSLDPQIDILPHISGAAIIFLPTRIKAVIEDIQDASSIRFFIYLFILYLILVCSQLFFIFYYAVHST